MENKTYIKAIKEDGNIDLIAYGIHTEVDTLTYMEVEGKTKNQLKNYLIIDSINIIDRFPSIRGSFSKLSLAMLFLEITYRSNSGLGILLKGLDRLKVSDSDRAAIYFFYIFLKENGIFNEDSLNLSQINLIKQIEENAHAKANSNTLKVLKKKLLKAIEDYIVKPLNSLKLLR